MTVKHTKGKTRVELVPYDAIEAIARAREYGVNKYGTEWEWYDHGTTEDFVSAAIRHLYKWNDARRLDNRTEEDEESGLNHLDHAICSIAMAIALEHKSERDKFEADFAIMDKPGPLITATENIQREKESFQRQSEICKSALRDLDREWEYRLERIQSFNNPGISHEER